MEFKASARFQPLSPRKTRLVADLVRGVPVNKALDTLRLCRLRGSKNLSKLIRSALASAAEQHDADPDNLYISKIYVNGGPIRYGRLPRLRGMWTRIRIRSSHIHVVLAELEETETAEEKPAEKK
jgi:large subunit ribosomal protein L22